MVHNPKPIVIAAVTQKKLRDKIIRIKNPAFEMRAGDSDVSIEFIENYQPNLIVLDVAAATDKNLELSRLIKKNQSLSQVIVLQISPQKLFDGEGNVHEFECFADFYLAEPFDLNNLILLLRSLTNFQKKENAEVNDRQLILESQRDANEHGSNNIKLRESEERYRAFIEQSSEGIWRAELERPVSVTLPVNEQIEFFYKYGYIAECNDAMALMYNLESAKSLIGARISDLFVRGDPKNYEYFKAFINSNYRLTESESHERRADNTDVYFLNNLIGIVENNSLVRAWGTQRDITMQRRIETALRESEERFRQLAENLDDVFWVTKWLDGKASKVEYVSPAVERIWGIDPQQIYQNHENWIRLIHPDDLEQTLNATANFLTKGKYEAEYRIVLPSGDTRWVQDKGVAVHAADGKIERTMGIAEDVTDRIQITKALSEAEERVRLAMQAAEMYAWEIDLTKKEIKWSENAEKVLGFPAGTLPEHFEQAATFIHPDDVEPSRQAYNQALQNKNYEVEFRLVNPQGNEVWIQANGVVIRNANNEATRFVGISQNITIRKKAEDEILRLNQELQKRVDELQTLLEVLPVGISIADDATLQNFSSNRYITDALGLPEGSNLSANNENVNLKYDWHFFHQNKEIFAQDLPVQQAVINLKIIEKFEFDIQIADRPPVSFLANAAPLFDKSGTVRGAIGAFVDISERKRVEQERDELLEREQLARREAEFANRAKDEFLAVLSHELRTPLNAMYGWVRMLSSGTLDETMQKRAIEVIERNIQLQTKLIEDILDVSRIVSGKIKLDQRRVDLVSLIKSVTEMSRPTASLKQITLANDFKAIEPIAVIGDAERLQQVLSNLINNALKFTPAGGQVTIALEQLENSAKISVIDNGVGIQPDFLPHVFERFRQADSSSKRKHSGLGLGLAIVKHLTELHRGKVSVASEGEGKGTTFTIELPLEQVKETEKNENKLNQPDAHAFLFQNLRILTVEDEHDASEMLDALLTSHEAQTTSVNSAIDALKLLQKKEFDLLISDVGMPEMDGLELIKQVRKNSDLQHQKMAAIALTAYVGADDRERILAAGFDECLAKPINFDALQKAVAKLLNKKQEALA